MFGQLSVICAMILALKGGVTTLHVFFLTRGLITIYAILCHYSKSCVLPNSVQHSDGQYSMISWQLAVELIVWPGDTVLPRNLQIVL